MKLRRNVLTLVLGLCTVVAMAQPAGETRQIKEEGKTVFNPHWFMQLQVGAAHTVGEADFFDLVSPAAAIYAGYQFTPIWGLRFGLSGWQAKGATTGLNGTDYKYKYLQGNVDVMVDLSTVFAGYNPNRFFNGYGFIGIGVNGAFDNDEVTVLKNAGFDFGHYWEDSKLSPVGRIGLGTNLRLSERVGLNIEVNANGLSDNFNSKCGGNIDWQFNALVGLTIHLGKPTKKTEPVYYEPAPQPAPQPKPEPRPEPKPEPAPEPPAKVVAAPMTQNIFFDINSTVIRDSEKAKIDALVKYLNDNPEKKVTITGYADKPTGNPRINNKLSEGRAAVVADDLKARGISADRITTDHKGDTVQPFAKQEENRVSICITD